LAPRVIKWVKQAQFIPGYFEQVGAITSIDSEYLDRLTEFTIILHDSEVDEVKVIRKVYLPLECFHALWSSWSTDINFHSRAAGAYPAIAGMPFKQMVHLSRKWVITDDTAKEV